MLQKQIITIPVSGGLDTKTDPFLVEQGFALELENARFHKAGSLSKKFGRALVTSTTNDTPLTSKTISAIIGDEEYLEAATSDGMYGYSSADQQWTRNSRFSISARAKSEFVHKNYLDQKSVDCDLTSDGTYMAYACAQNQSTLFKSVLVVLEDMATGLKKSVTINNAANINLQRVIAEKSGGILYVHLFYYVSGSGINHIVYDKNLSVVGTETTVTTFTDQSQFDVCKDSTNIFLAKITGTALSMFRFTLPGVQDATGTATLNEALKQQSTYAGGMSVCATTSNLHVGWCSTNLWNVRGFTKALASQVSVFNEAGDFSKIGINSTAAGICVIASSVETASVQQVVAHNLTFTTSYTDVEGFLTRRLTLASQPFEVQSKLLAICKCSESNNKNFYLVNFSDQHIMAILSPGLTVDNLLAFGNTDIVSMLPKSSALAGSVYTALSRRVRLSEESIDAGEFFSTSGMTKAVFDFTISYKDNARSKVGESVYLTKGSTIEIDHRAPHENGFMLNPFAAAAQNTGVGNPNVASKTINYMVVYEYLDSFGQITRSSPSNQASVTTNANAASVAVSFRGIPFSLKNSTTFAGVSRAPVAAIYRAVGSVFYRLTEVIISDNQGADYSYNDSAADSSLTNNEQIYTTGGILGNDPAPVAGNNFSGGNRLFLVDLEEKDEVAYSKKQLHGESVAFSDFFRIRISSGTFADKTPLNSGGYMDGKVVLFRKKSIYIVSGDGPNETGNADGFSEPESIASDVGCINPRSVLLTPAGLMFKSEKGIYILTRGLSVEYIGKEVEDFNSQNIVASVLVGSANEARFYTDAGNCLVYNFLTGAWSDSISQTSVDADLWNDMPVQIISGEIHQEQDGVFTDDAAYTSLRIKTAWIKLSGIQDFGRIWRLWILGKFKSAHTLVVKARYDYNDDYVETFTINPSASDSQYQYSCHLRKQKCESVQFEIYDEDQSGTGESFELTGLTLEVGVRKGAMKLPASRKY